jgi:hypothetical protein
MSKYLLSRRWKLLVDIPSSYSESQQELYLRPVLVPDVLSVCEASGTLVRRALQFQALIIHDERVDSTPIIL